MAGSVAKDNYYMADSVFAMRLVHLRSVTIYGPKFQRKKSFWSSESLYLGKKQTSINLEDLDFDFVLQYFKLCLFVNEGDEKTNL